MGKSNVIKSLFLWPTPLSRHIEIKHVIRFAILSDYQNGKSRLFNPNKIAIKRD